MSVGVPEFDAAQALLDLSGVSEHKQNDNGNSEESVDTEKSFLGCSFISENEEQPPTGTTLKDKVGTVIPLYLHPKSADEPSEEPSTSTQPQKRKSPDKELPRDPRITAIQEGQVSKRTKLFKRKPVKFCPATIPLPLTVPAYVPAKVPVSVKVLVSATVPVPVAASTVLSSINTSLPSTAPMTLHMNVPAPVPSTSASTSTSNTKELTNIKQSVEVGIETILSKAGTSIATELSNAGTSNAKQMPVDDSNDHDVKTRDVGTQTDDLFEFPPADTVESTINKLCEKIKTLEAQIHTNSQLIDTINNDTSDDYEDEEETSQIHIDRKTMNVSTSTSTNDTITEEIRRETRPKNKTGSNRIGHKSSKVLSNRNTNTDVNDMVSIGCGHAKIPNRIFRHINWNSYTSATRKLLTAVFSRRVLATHSLTGKPSPAFPLKPPKERLNVDIVNDIVQTVVDRCNVPENVVRTSITTKCADESKMFRTRQQNKKKRKQKVNRENIPPDSESE